MMYGPKKKIKDKMNPKRMTKSYGGGMPTPARKKASAGRIMYKDGGQPEYKSGEMPKCMPR